MNHPTPTVTPRGMKAMASISDETWDLLEQSQLIRFVHGHESAGSRVLDARYFAETALSNDARMYFADLLIKHAQACIGAGCERPQPGQDNQGASLAAPAEVDQVEDTRTDQDEEEITQCPWCGAYGPLFDESCMPADYCHHDLPLELRPLANSLNGDTGDALGPGLAALPLSGISRNTSQGLKPLIDSPSKPAALGLFANTLGAAQAVHTVSGEDVHHLGPCARLVTVGIAAFVDSLGMASPDQAQSQSSNQLFHRFFDDEDNAPCPLWGSPTADYIMHMGDRR